MEEKILTMHPKGKKGVRIDKKKYDIVRASIIESLKSKGQLTHTDLSKNVEEKLKGKFEGSIKWYTETVKLDLEAKKLLKEYHKPTLNSTD